MDKVQQKKMIVRKELFSVTLKLNYLKGEAWPKNFSESVFFNHREKGRDLG
jgi:hypothetical protein